MQLIADGKKKTAAQSSYRGSAENATNAALTQVTTKAPWRLRIR